MDLFNEPRANRAIQSVDKQATDILTAYVNDKTYRNPTDDQKLMPGLGGSGGKMTIKIRYIYSALNEIKRIVDVRFNGDAGDLYTAGPITLYASTL
jgi:hypothetical protein